MPPSRDNFNPEWLPPDPDVFGRWGMGLEIDCPTHIGCRLHLWFSNPVDGGPPMKVGGNVRRLYMRLGHGFGDIGIREKVDAGRCGVFWIREGLLLRKLI